MSQTDIPGYTYGTDGRIPAAGKPRRAGASAGDRAAGRGRPDCLRRCRATCWLPRSRPSSMSGMAS